MEPPTICISQTCISGSEVFPKKLKVEYNSVATYASTSPFSKEQSNKEISLFQWTGLKEATVFESKEHLEVHTMLWI